METQILPEDVRVFGFRVDTFPMGIGEAFDELIKKLPQGDKRLYYGISECIEGRIVYIAAAEETYAGEGEKYGLETYFIEKGEYLTTTVFDWMDKTASIRYVFEEMFKNERADRSKACVEIYKSDNEMICMVMLNSKN